MMKRTTPANPRSAFEEQTGIPLDGRRPTQERPASDASPYVLGKRVMFPAWPRPRPLATFSCHWAAVAALVRLHHPDFRSTGGDRHEDLAAESGLREAITAAKAQLPGRLPRTAR